jgi:hypothetical protein
VGCEGIDAWTASVSWLPLMPMVVTLAQPMAATSDDTSVR